MRRFCIRYASGPYAIVHRGDNGGEYRQIIARDTVDPILRAKCDGQRGFLVEIGK